MKDFTIIKNELLDKEISDGAFRLYCILESYCFGDKDTCFPSQKTLGTRLKKCVRTIQRYINELVTAGMIKIKRRGSISNVYIMAYKSVSQKISKTIEGFKEKVQNYYSPKKDVFNDYPQRKYDFEKLERALLGVDKNVNLEELIIK